MSKRNKIIYWIATGWFCLGMLSTGIVQLPEPGISIYFLILPLIDFLVPAPLFH